MSIPGSQGIYLMQTTRRHVRWVPVICAIRPSLEHDVSQKMAQGEQMDGEIVRIYPPTKIVFGVRSHLGILAALPTLLRQKTQPQCRPWQPTGQ